MSSKAAPVCQKCGTNEHVLRFWHGRMKMWVCSVHFKVGSTKTEPQTLKERVLHRDPKQEEFALTDILPNRAARRRRK